MPQEVEATYCPICGARLWRQKDVTIQQYDYHNESISGFRVITDRCTGNVFVAGEMSEIDDYHNELPLEIDPNRIDMIRKGLRDILAPLGLWDESEFGIWSAM